MGKEIVVFFKPYPLHPGQKIHIQEGPRRGDWWVETVTERKVTLRCPVSGKILESERFCYFVKETPVDRWPGE